MQYSNRFLAGLNVLVEIVICCSIVTQIIDWLYCCQARKQLRIYTLLGANIQIRDAAIAHYWVVVAWRTC